MMNSNKTIHEQKDNNLISYIRFRFVPYWPLFAIMIALFATGAVVYLKWTPKVYQAKADLLIKDEKKGSDDGRMLESLNIFTTKKIVEDEIEVLQSQTVMKQVVRNLRLYAPVIEKGRFKSLPAYNSSPIVVEAMGYDTLYKTHQKVFIAATDFRYDSAAQQVHIGAQSYPMSQWVSYPGCFVPIRFLPNPYYTEPARRALSFMLLNPKMVTNNLIHQLNVSATNKLSSVVTLTMSDEIPQRAENVLNELIGVYNSASINDKNQLATNTLSFVENRLRHVKTELDNAESKLQVYKRENGGADLSQQSEAFLKTVGENDQKVAEINMQLAALNEVEKYVKSDNGTSGIVPATLGVNDEGLTKMLEKLNDARSNYEKLRKTVGEKDPTMVSLTTEMQKIRPSILENIRISKMSLQAGLGNLTTTNDLFARKLQSLPEKERTLLESSRQQTILNNVYSFLLQKREEASLSYASTVSDSRTINGAESSLDPIAPKKMIVLVAALVAAVVISGGIVYGKEFFNNRVLFRREIETFTSLPIVAEISKIEGGGKKITDDPRRVFLAEQFRQLRTALGLHAKNNSNKKILVTSSISGEGKSFVSSGLAQSLAKAGKKSVLLDFDLRNPKISSEFKLTSELGLSDFLAGELEPYEIIKSTSEVNLFVIPVGKEAGHFQELSFNPKLTELFDYLAGVFDFIVIDTPPVNPISDAYILSQYSDISLYVVRHDFTPKAFIQLLDENNKIKPLNNLVLVFNGIKSRGFFKGQYGLDLGYGNEFAVKNKRANGKKKLFNVKP